MVLALLPFRRSGYTETFFFQGGQTMLATIDRPTETKTSSLPRVTFNEETRVIHATVTISRDESGKYHHRVSPMSAAGPAGSRWTVIWTLEPSAGLKATFRDPGIVKMSVPEGVKNRNLMKIVDSVPPQWQFTFTNEVTDVNVIRYNIDLNVETLEGNSLTPHRLTIDPTIAVVREPIDG